MAIRGSLAEAGLPDVIQMLHLARRTGCLALADRGRHASVFFEDGWVVHATIVNRPDRLGDLLVKRGRVSAAQLDEAMRLQARHGDQRIGEVLVGLGAITPDQLRDVIRQQVEEAVFALFNWRSGTFTFEPALAPESGVEPVRIPPDALMLEGARRIDEWSVIEKKIPSFDLIFARDPAAPDPGTLDLTAPQQRLLPLLDGVRDVRALIEESGLWEFDACQALYGLLSAGVIHRVGTSTMGPSARSRETQLDEHRNLGIAFYRTGMLEEAVREFRRVMELRPGEGLAPFFLGLIAARRGQWGEAVYFFRGAVDRAGPRPAILHNLGVALAEAGEDEQAESTLADAASRAAEQMAPHLAWGLVALDRGATSVAISRLRRARDLAGDAPPALWYWGMVRALVADGNLEAARPVSEEGLSRFPAHPVLLNNHAVLLEAAGDLVGAERVLGQALEADASVPQVSKNLGDVLYRLGRFDEATAAYERAARLAPELGEDLYFKLGNLALRRGDNAAARQHWTRTVELNPGHQLARANLQMLGAGG